MKEDGQIFYCLLGTYYRINCWLHRYAVFVFDLGISIIGLLINSNTDDFIT